MRKSKDERIKGRVERRRNEKNEKIRIKMKWK